MYDNCNVALSGTVSVKLPSKSVTVPVVVPLTRILTPIIGSDVSASITLPFAVKSANAETAIKRLKKIACNRFIEIVIKVK